MGIDFTVFKGSAAGDIVQATGHREPGPTEAIVKLSHCGVCGTDELYRHTDMGLGHEGIGVIVEVGSAVESVSKFRVGDRVGMGWFHKFCGQCKSCLTGRQNECPNSTAFGSADTDQGCFGTAVAWDVSALFKIPDEIASEDAGPLVCGGATVWSPLYTAGLRAGDRVGIVGVGGLGHLAIQFASKMGLEAVVFSGSVDKRDKAFEFGASEFHHITSGTESLSSEAKVDVLLVTAGGWSDFTKFLPILSPGAKVFTLAASFHPIQLSPIHLNMSGLSVHGSLIASVASVQAMLAFAAKHSVRPQIEKFAMTQEGVTEAMEKLRNGKMRYRGVLVV